MAKQGKQKSAVAPVRGASRMSARRGTRSRARARTAKAKKCEDCRAATAFQAWHSVSLKPSLNVDVSFADWKIIPAGKRAVIELVTAQIVVPAGEWARLRMYTALGGVASNIDLYLTFQGNVSGNATFTATHALRAYSDSQIEFNINRDNGTTAGSALICISGYIAD
jgi:hypothetical protein